MNNQEIVQKLWNLCNVLRDDGITYQQYLTELTYILFLKMMHEKAKLSPKDRQNVEHVIPEEYRWDSLVKLEGIELKNHYQRLLLELGRSENELLRQIYADASTSISEPKNLEKMVHHQIL
ncbi:hypothetical protein T260_01185 [Geobacillus thermopakistaniensis]|uniref:site-specific DNA-methyltransferase (adenine-specific) n=1 Tax=Geobacillus thermopakistaniensis (strain MAS1) TaxID=1408282 RepID=A0A7U9JDQ3_GEOTM|nr:hypothetical protein T260_01185 [Geobacillus sp. MAS1]